MNGTEQGAIAAATRGILYHPPALQLFGMPSPLDYLGVVVPGYPVVQLFVGVLPRTLPVLATLGPPVVQLGIQADAGPANYVFTLLVTS